MQNATLEGVAVIRFEVNQKLVPLRFRVKEAWLGRLLQAIEKHLGLRGSSALSIAFVDHQTMRRLNRTYRGKDRVTDILSFAYSIVPERSLRLRRTRRRRGRATVQSLGELLLAWPYVRDQAKRHGKTLKQELALLITHGVLHLRGYDHETTHEARRMLPLQDEILRKFLISNS